MDFDESKENIQPLAAGRNASILHASLRLQSSTELLEQRRTMEEQINNYAGDDPLEPWYAYISWIEQSFPSGGKESGLEEVLTKCLARFEGEVRYYQDRRMIKLFIKFIDSHKDPTECYQQLCDAGIGTMVADLYICWAYYYDLSGQTRRADEIFRRGIACRAEPLEELQEAHQHFNFAVAQLLMYQDNEDYRQDATKQLQERRIALTSLRGHRRKAAVGSVRTGGVVKSFVPGVVKTDTAATSKSKRNNEKVQIFNDENNSCNVPAKSAPEEDLEESAPQESKSVIRSIIDAARNQENQKEPGPWNKAHDKKKTGKLFGKAALNTDLGFSIHVDDVVAVESNQCDVMEKHMSSPIKDGDRNFNKPFKCPLNFQCKNRPQSEWNTPVTIENEPDARSFPAYNKCMLYPRPNMELQMEELRAYHWFKRRGIGNTFTRLRDAVWSSRNVAANIRRYPNFATRSRPQSCDELDKYCAPPKVKGLAIAFDQIYDTKEEQEFQFEELMARRFMQNKTTITTTDMEETVCLPSDRVQRRKSFFPARKTIAPRATESISVLSPPPLDEFIKSTQEHKAGGEEAESDLKFSMKEKSTKNLKTHFDCNESSEILQSTAEKCSQKIPNQSVLPASTDDLNFEKIHSQLEEEAPASVDSQHKSSADLKISSTIPSQSEVLTGEEFKFKAPAAPTTTKSVAKLPFTIFTETSLTSAAAKAPMETDAATAYEADETCSTQTFNIFLKSQSMSTPKAAQKTAPRQFGTLLRDASSGISAATGSLFSQAGHHEQDPSTVSPIVAICPYAEAEHRDGVPYSPQTHKQLSTILETSEHGTTQGTTNTHTTGSASTKSTISSPEFDSVWETKLTGAGRLIVTAQHSSEEKTLEEQSRICATSTATSTANGEVGVGTGTGNADNLQMMPINPASSFVGDMTNNMQQTQELLAENTPTMPAAIRTCGGGGGGLNFSIFVDPTEVELPEPPKCVGNFTHLEEREDTAVGLPLPTVRFQEDKTETISKMLFPAREEFKFQDDKTETISKMLLPSREEFKLPVDKNESISKMLLPSREELKFQDDKTETPAAAVATKHFAVDDKKVEPSYDPINLEDSFEFFAKTPSKIEKLKPVIVNKNDLLNSFECSFSDRSPLTAAVSKRFCDIDTPQAMSKTGATKTTKYPARTDTDKETAMQNFMDDSYLQFGKNASIAQLPPSSETTPAPKQTSSNPPKESKKILFNDFHVPDMSLVQTKSTAAAAVANTSVSFIKDSQPYSATGSYRQERSLLYASASKSQLGNSLLNDFSRIMDSQPLQPETKWKKSMNTLTARAETKELNNHMLMSSYMKDFSAVNEPPKTQHAEAAMTESKAERTITFLNDSTAKQTSTGAIPKTRMPTTSPAAGNSSMLSSSLRFLSSSGTKDALKMPHCRDPITSQSIFETTTTRPHIQTEYQHKLSSADQSLELNAATQMFSANSSQIKNSTWLTSRDASLHQSQIRESSLHIKAEAPSPAAAAAGQQIDLESSYSISKSKPLPSMSSKHKSDLSKPAELSFLGGSTAVKDTSYAMGRLTIDTNAPALGFLGANKPNNSSLRLPFVQNSSENVPSQEHKCNNDDDNDNDDNEFSIYQKETPKTPKIQIHSWDEVVETPESNHYVHQEVDLDQTHQIIENIRMDPKVNPFNTDLINAFLEQIEFSNYINALDTCMLLGRVSSLSLTSLIRVHQTEFKILKLIGEGAYGAVYCGLDPKTGKKYALKQERPPNYWEYYICLEVHSRLHAEEMHAAFMSIDYALIGNNSSILISAFSQYGSLITVCNKIKKYTLKNLDEYVVMYLTCELLEIIDHLHAIGIIHADIKADNILLINKLNYPCTERSLQLIDYGVSIDMKCFKEGQTFSYVNKEIAFKCAEMREERPWTFQLDLYGLAGIVHVLLFGKYMDIEKRVNGIWMHKTHVPRYINKSLWDTIFKTLLNVHDCVSLPNLQHLRAMIKEEIAEKEEYVIKKISDFNRALGV